MGSGRNSMSSARSRRVLQPPRPVSLASLARRSHSMGEMREVARNDHTSLFNGLIGGGWPQVRLPRHEHPHAGGFLLTHVMRYAYSRHS